MAQDLVLAGNFAAQRHLVADPTLLIPSAAIERETEPGRWTMTRRFRSTLAVLCGAAASVVAMAGPAAGAPPDAPGRLCQDGNWFAIQYEASYDGATGKADGLYVRRTPTTGGCASSWAQGKGQLSTAAIASQCRTGIEARFGPYPITLRFAQTYVLQNRADCISVMSGIAHGEIDPGRAPLFPGGN